MPTTLQYKEIRIELFDDSAYTHMQESPTEYDKIIQEEKDKQYAPVSQHAIKVYKDDALVRSAIILASAGGTSVHNDTALIDNGNLIVRCCNRLFCLTLPDLEQNWAIEPDWATCFSIHQYQDTYICHGETSISRIDRTGNILWNYGGADIFVTLYEGTAFEMHDAYIAMTDFNGSKYKIDYNGNTLAFEEPGHNKKTGSIDLG